jgi:GNAT superfamily N-acetyltransferase
MMNIREFKYEDLNAISHLQPEGWSDIVPFFRFYFHQEFCYPIVAAMDDKIAGVANAILNGSTGWLAHIIVSKNYRNRGIGYVLTEHLINYLYKAGCKTQLLIATELGENLYRKFGFETVSEYLFFNEGSISSVEADKHIRPFRKSDRKELLDIDLEVSGEYRENMLSPYLSNAFIYSTDNCIGGFFLSDFEEGKIIARNNEAGITLLKFKHSASSRKSVLPIENTFGKDYLISQGFKIVNRAPRMILGPKISWKPELIFSRAGGFFG